VIFILQNRQSVEVSYLGLNGHMPLAAAMLISVAAGLLLAAIAGSVRILQLRRRVRRLDR
jgi:lipopolysaccharide assembly protein A